MVEQTGARSRRDLAVNAKQRILERSELNHLEKQAILVGNRPLQSNCPETPMNNSDSDGLTADPKASRPIGLEDPIRAPGG